MPKTLWDEASRKELIDRLSRLTPDAKPRWGKMNASQMLAHLGSQMRMTKGDLPTKSKNLPLRYPPLKQLIVYWLPFPRGAPTAPELLVSQIDDWDSGVADVRAQIVEFGTFDRNRAWPEHPAFGQMTPQAWGVLGYRHTDHHFRQFGV
ncbi:MAG: DUF1569 domain-containing protein [Gemmatimonadales bacterium]